MFVGCESSVYIFTLDDKKYKLSDTGCVSHESIASYKTLTFWAADDGIYQTNGGDVQKISTPLQEIWDTISTSDKANIQAKIKGDDLCIYVGSITVDDVTHSNIMLIWDISQSDWNIIKLGTSVTHLHTFVTSTGKELFMGDNNGKVYQMFTSGGQNGSEFKSMIETDWFYGSDPKAKEEFKELWGFGNDLSGIAVYYKTDRSNNKWMPTKSLDGAIDHVKFEASGRRIKFLLQETSKGNLFEIDRLEIGYIPTGVSRKDNES